MTGPSMTASEEIRVEYEKSVAAIVATQEKIIQTANELFAFHVALEKQRVVMEARYHQWGIVDAFIESRCSQVDSAVKVNVRGSVMSIKKEQLLAMQYSYFPIMLCSTSSEMASDYFIDRFEVGFEHMIRCIVAGELNYKGYNAYDVSCIDSNLEFFGFPSIYQRSAYRRIHRIQDNILSRGYDRTVKFLVELKDGRLAIGNEAGVVKIWNLATSKCEKIIDTIHDIVQMFQLQDGRLCTLSPNDSLDFWDIRTGSLVFNIIDVGYRGASVIQLKDTTLCSLTCIGDLMTFDVVTGALLKLNRVYIHQGHASVIQLRNSNLVTSTNADREIDVWDAQSLDRLFSFDATDGIMHMLELYEGILCLTTPFHIEMWDLEGESPSSIANVATDILIGPPVKLKDGRIVCGGPSARIFNAESGCFDQTLTKRKHWHRCPTIQLLDGRIVIARKNSVTDIWSNSKHRARLDDDPSSDGFDDDFYEEDDFDDGNDDDDDDMFDDEDDWGLGGDDIEEGDSDNPDDDEDFHG